MLEINNLHVEVENKEILSGIDLKVKAGEMHAIMGLNGSGKSTLSNAITGRENYNVTKGDIIFKDEWNQMKELLLVFLCPFNTLPLFQV